MHGRTISLIDGNEAAASVAYRCSEVIAIYPITPSSPMGESADEWAAAGKPNLWGMTPQVVEMQSEGGVAGAVHGALQAGTLATSFTASQGLLLMIPNLYKIAAELTPFVLHVAARTVAAHALSIFGDHSDVMACRQIGVGILSAGSVQEAHDLALVAHAATLRSRVPFIHFFDGFRTSHEVNGVVPLTDDDLRAVIDDDAIAMHRRRALSPDHPVIRGTAQNPDTYFQAREAVNPWYDRCPTMVQEAMTALAERVGRAYKLYEYQGHPAAERVIVAMGSGAETARETARWLAVRGEKVGVVTVRLYRPFAVSAFVQALPSSTRAVAVLDRTKEPGAIGEPLYMDVVAALAEAAPWGGSAFERQPVVTGGRYGLSSKELTPAMVKAVFDNLAGDQPRRHFTVGITDDVTHSSLAVGEDLDIDPPGTRRAVFFGLGADGTVGANKNSIKIIAEEAGVYGQAYFVYDSKKSGSVTVSHLRLSAEPIHAPYLVNQAEFVACHHFPLIERMDILERAAPGATVLLNASGTPEEVWGRLPREAQQQAITKRLKLCTIDATRIARDKGLKQRINTIMQTCFFGLTEVMSTEVAIAGIKAAIDKTYGRRSDEVVRQNHAAVDDALSHLGTIQVPDAVTANHGRALPVPDDAPDFVQRVTAVMLAGRGDLLPVSAFPPDGTWPSGTSRYEKRGIATMVPVWNADICIECNKCALVCPHGVIRMKPVAPEVIAAFPPPPAQALLDYRGDEFAGAKYVLSVSADDCTGCTLCVVVCPAKDKGNPRRKALEMRPAAEVREEHRAAFAWYLSLPEADRTRVPLNVKQTQFLQPLFEFAGACSGCGETPYIKLLTQLFGDRALIGNATGCTSIYGGNLPTTPYAFNAEGRGPAWSNSLFEDNAEFGFGLRLGVDQLADEARFLLGALASRLPGELVDALLAGRSRDEAAVAAGRAQVALLKQRLADVDDDPRAGRLAVVADYLIPKSVWILGGDGWAYDIGYGGLDHVLASDRNVNILVLDTEVYSNTGGQQSKATPLGASAKFAVAGRPVAKKDLGVIAMAYGHVYVATVAFGAKDAQTLRAFVEAESYDGPSLIIAYCHCIAHGFDLAQGLAHQKMAVESGHWPLYRFDPRRLASGEKPLILDSGAPNATLATFMAGETRFRAVQSTHPARYPALVKAAEHANRLRFERLRFAAGFEDVAAKEAPPA